jgi:TrmH family RNA methyltransferase
MNHKLSKAKISLINSLIYPKYRNKHKLFIAEGQKIITEIFKSDYKINSIIFNLSKTEPSEFPGIKTFTCTDDEMKKISNLKNPSPVLALVNLPEKKLNIFELKDELCIAVEDIQDPGNLGTLIRICDWFGIKNLVCSKNSADIFNPKTIQATMGSFVRVNVFYEDFNLFLSEYKSKIKNPIYGTFLDGENIYKTELPKYALLVLGNEGHGISKQTKTFIDRKLFIPPFDKYGNHAESLNISVAAGIVCSEFRRRLI